MLFCKHLGGAGNLICLSQGWSPLCGCNLGSGEGMGYPRAAALCHPNRFISSFPGVISARGTSGPLAAATR